ncbi:hypothetical protein OV450_6435 [Actinobacteria bacterium OV450]|nr:hypothetical protein OV450_6435 [Actinobacteria bacterium OV450]
MAERRTYALAGIAMGAVWIMGSDTSPRDHALRLLALVTAAGVAMALLHRRRARLGRPVDRRLHSGLLLGKVLLVVVALALDGLLGLWVSEPSLITAALLCLIIAFGGPSLHRWLARDGEGRREGRRPAPPVGVRFPPEAGAEAGPEVEIGVGAGVEAGPGVGAGGDRDRPDSA